MPDNMTVFGTKQALPNQKAHYAFVKLKKRLGMQTPYEEKKVEFSKELLKTKANDIRINRSRYNNYVEKLRYLVWDLEHLWQNDIQSSFIVELGNLQGSIIDYSEHVEGFAAFLDMASAALEKTPVDLPKPSMPTEDDEPIHVVLSNIPELKKTQNNMEEYGPFAKQAAKKQENKNLKYYVIKLLSKLGLKNSQDKNGARLDPQSLKTAALDMRSIITQYDYNVRKIQNDIELLQRLWENDIQTSLIEELEDYMNAVKDFSSLANEYASLLEIAAHELETNSVDADKASVLSNGSVGPVTVVLANIPYLKRSRIDLKAFDPYFEETQTGVSTEISLSRKNAEYLYHVYDDHIELVKYIGLKKTVEIPAELDKLPVTHIGLDCFAMAWRVRFTSIVMPDSVTTVYHGAFRGCHTIRELKLSKNLKYIGNYAFSFLSELEYIELPENVVSFGMGAFRNCLSLKSVSIPRTTLKRIGNDCFYGCKRLECVVIGDGVVEIEDWAFRMCEHLKSVTIGENVENIGESAFYDCIRLNRLDIPETVSNIGETAFYSRRGITLGVIEGSAAEKYAVDHRLPYVNI